MRIRIVCYEEVNAWILGKTARRLCEHLNRTEGVTADIGRQADPAADVNHHIIFTGYEGKQAALETLMITHVDTQDKVDQLKRQLKDAAMGICMSADTLTKLARLGVPRDRLCHVNPAHDFVVKPRKIVIGITSRVHWHGSKREYLVAQLAERISPDDFKFRIMGAGWDIVADTLRKRGVEVDHSGDFDPVTYPSFIEGLDYYLYPGQDEGSVGFMDALAAGIPTIVTPQGFHLDAKGGITHPFNDFEDLVRILGEIAEDRNRRVRAVSNWTWAEYARKHLAIWKALVARSRGGPSTDGERAELRILGVQLEHMPAESAIFWPLPPEPGPGGAAHRPRILVVADEPKRRIEARCRLLNRCMAGRRDIVFSFAGQPYDRRPKLEGAGWEFKWVDLRAFSEQELAELAGDFTAVCFYRVVPSRLIDRLQKRRVTNYRFLQISHQAAADRLRRWGVLRGLFFRFIRSLRFHSRWPVIVDLSGEQSVADDRAWRTLRGADGVIANEPGLSAALSAGGCRVYPSRERRLGAACIEERVSILAQVLPSAVDAANAATRPPVMLQLMRRVGRGMWRFRNRSRAKLLS